MEKDEVDVKIQEAINKFKQNDLKLLEFDCNERTITGRIGIYLQEQFPNFNVDCEYNRDGMDTKRLGLDINNVSNDDINATTVYPDIIVHHRGVDKMNLLVIEAKKVGNNNSQDKKKLKAYANIFKYKYTILLSIPKISSDDFTFEYINT